MYPEVNLLLAYRAGDVWSSLKEKELFFRKNSPIVVLRYIHFKACI
jgi:hypothetical protein